MTIMQRGVVHGVLADVACTGRFYDFFERRHQPLEQRGAQSADRLGGVSADRLGGVSADRLGGVSADRLGGVSADRLGGESADRLGAQSADRLGGECGESRWAIVLRQPIYEKDRLDPVDPAATVTLDPDLLNAFPEGYRHLAYLQTHLGFAVKPDMPGLRGPEVQRLYARGAAWLDGELAAWATR